MVSFTANTEEPAFFHLIPKLFEQGNIDRMMEPIYLYFTAAGSDSAKQISDSTASVVPVDLERDAQAREQVSQWTDHRSDVSVVVRVGDKIKCLFFNPTPTVLARMFDPNSTADASELNALPITVFSADWCPDCRLLERYLKQWNKPHARIDIETTPGAADNVIRWSGGRRVIPTVHIGDDIRLFNPGPQVVAKLLNLKY